MTTLMLRAFGRRADGPPARGAGRGPGSREVLQEETGEGLRLLPPFFQIARERRSSERRARRGARRHGRTGGGRGGGDGRNGRARRSVRRWSGGTSGCCAGGRGGRRLQRRCLCEEAGLHLVGDVAEDARVVDGLGAE